jgi:hypothetical protein
MALSLQLGYPDIPKSITNPNVQKRDALDVGEPMTFLTFIKIINESFSPNSLQEYYNTYIKSWNSQNNLRDSNEKLLILTSYKNFLKEINLNYSTEEERTFLKNIDFNDPYDMDIAIGFYSKKLNQIVKFYNDKRNDVKFNIVRSKLRGSNFGIEKSITELVISYLKNLDGGSLIYNIDTIKSNLELEISELYDSYPEYYNQTPDVTIYDKKDLDYGYNIFLKSNEDLITEIFPDISEELKNLKEVDNLFDTKRALSEKYLSTDFYYLSTGNSVYDFTTGKILTSQNPVGNFLNRDYPTTASTQNYDNLKDKRSIGFFKPSRISIILVDGITKEYQPNFDNLSPNTIYYFPDPNIIGNNGDVLTFTIDDSFLRKNFSSGKSANEPISTAVDTKYYGYVSKIDPNTVKYLNDVFNSGFIEDYKQDIYSNTYGLFKNDHRFKQTVKYQDSSILYNVLLNGYQFFDTLFGEELEFDYDIVDYNTFDETKRSGLIAYTHTFDEFIPEFTLNFGRFTQYNELIQPTEQNLLKDYLILDGGFLLNEDNSYPDPVSSDLSAFELSNEPFYYDWLVEGALHNDNPVQRALLDPSYPTLSADITKFIRSSDLLYLDGERFDDFFDSDIVLSRSNYEFDSTNVFNKTIIEPDTNSFNSIYYNGFPIYYNGDYLAYNASNIDPDYVFNGILMVKNIFTREVLPISQAFSYIPTKFGYDADILTQIENNVIEFEIVQDIIIIKTKNYTIFDKIKIENFEFVDPKTDSIVIEHSTTPFDKISNRYKLNNFIYFCKMVEVGSLSSNDYIVYPEIYELDVINFKNTQIYPDMNLNNLEFFNISGAEVSYTLLDTPTITHSSVSNTFNISFLLKDQNHMFSIHELDFHLSPDVIFTSNNIIRSNLDRISNNLSDLSTLTVYLSTQYTQNLNELII